MWGRGSVLVIQLCLTLCHPLNCSLLGSSVHGILQARILEWAAIPFSRGSFQPWDWTWVSREWGEGGSFFSVRQWGQPVKLYCDTTSFWFCHTLSVKLEGKSRTFSEPSFYTSFKKLRGGRLSFYIFCLLVCCFKGICVCVYIYIYIYLKILWWLYTSSKLSCDRQGSFKK